MIGDFHSAHATGHLLDTGHVIGHGAFSACLDHLDAFRDHEHQENNARNDDHGRYEKLRGKIDEVARDHHHRHGISESVYAGLTHE